MSNQIIYQDQINQITDNAGVQRALQIMSESMARADEIIAAAGKAGIDHEWKNSVRFIENPDGTRIVEIATEGRLSKEPG